MRLPYLVAAVLFLYPAVAAAEDECEDGEWFCDEQDQAEEPADAPPAAAPRRKPDPPPVVVYTPKGQEKPKQVIVVERAAPAPPPPKRRKKREWAFNLHLAAALMGDDEHKSDDAEMGGIGFAFRYRPVPVVAIDAGIDLLGGTDWNGYDRRETAFLANCLLFFNPRDKIQIFWFGGFGMSGARVDVVTEEDEFEERYSYFGLQTGLGLEARISKKVAVGGDILGFVRGRTDAETGTRPEFVDPETHRATNASGGGLLRGGVTFYW